MGLLGRSEHTILQMRHTELAAKGSRSWEMPTKKYLHQHLTCQSQSVLSWSLYQVTNNLASTNWKQKHKQHFKRAPRRTFHLHIQKRLIFPRADQFQNQLTTHPKEQNHKWNFLKSVLNVKTQQEKLYFESTVQMSHVLIPNEINQLLIRLFSSSWCG